MRAISMRFAQLAAALVLSFVFVAAPAGARWEAVSGTANGSGGADGIAGRSPVYLRQYSYNWDPAAPWAYFAFNISGTSRSLIILNDLNDPTVKAIHERLLDAFRENKPVRWLRNSSSATATSGNWWQGYMNTSYTIRAGDPVELIVDN
jgi:hypothetical protein